MADWWVWLLDPRIASEQLHDENGRRHRAALRAIHRARRRRSPPSGDRIAELERDVARLALFSMTLGELLVRKGVATRDELAALAAEIDAADGTSDGATDRETLRRSTPGPREE